MADIKFVQAETLKEKPADISKVGFGRVFTDYMFEMDYNPEQGWHDARIVPYQEVPLSPANATLHYGQAIFEGCKAYRYKGGKAVVFRAKDHIARLNRSAKILDIPAVDEKLVYEALMKLIDLEKDWIPDGPGQSLYIRPFIFSTDPYLGVSVGQFYKMMIILSPVGAYYANGFAPVKIMVEDTYVRAPKGGLGAAKTPANYAASLHGGLIAHEKGYDQTPAKTPANYAASLHGGLIAHEKGYDQTLWTDGIEHKYIGEVGSMNILFKIDGKVVTPELDGTILDGITRRTVLRICKEWGVPTEERRISIDELIEDYENGKLEEVFGSGTAAVISPVSVLGYKGQDRVISGGKIGEFAQKLYDYIDDLHTGKAEDIYGFIDVAGEY